MVPGQVWGLVTPALRKAVRRLVPRKFAPPRRDRAFSPLGFEPVRVGLPVQFADSLFQLGAFADPGELFACCGELASLFGRTGNFAASH